MRDSMKEKSRVMRKAFIEKGWPYFCYRLGEKSFGCIRIGQWKQDIKTFDPKRGRFKREAAKFNVTPKKMEKQIKSFGQERVLVIVHLHLAHLPEEQQAEWRAAFPEAVIDTEETWQENE